MASDITLKQLRNAKETLEETLQGAVEVALREFASSVEGAASVGDIDIDLTPIIASQDYRARDYFVGVNVTVRL